MQVLLLICYFASDGDANESNKVPCVLHMDSIRGSHAGLKGLVQRYQLLLFLAIIYLTLYLLF